MREASGGAPPRTQQRNRLGLLALLMAIVLGVVFVIGLTTLRPQPSDGPVVEIVNGELHEQGVTVERGCLVFHDPASFRRQWEICSAELEMSSLTGVDIDDLASNEIQEPTLTIYSDDDDEAIRATVSSDTCRLDPAAKRLELGGHIIAVLDPLSPNVMTIEIEGPLVITADSLDDMTSAHAVAGGAVSLSSKRIQVSGRGLDIDLSEQRATFTRDVRLVALLEEGAGLPGAGGGTLVVSASGSAEIERYGGPEGIQPRAMLRDDVVVVSDDGSRLDCDELEILGVAKEHGFEPEQLTATGNARLVVTGAGEIQGELLVARRRDDGTWSTRVDAAEGGRISGQVDVPASRTTARRLSFSAAGEMTYARELDGGGTLSFQRDIRGDLSEMGASAPHASMSASEALEITIAGKRDGTSSVIDRGFGGAVEAIIARGAVTFEDRANEATESLAGTGEQLPYQVLRSSASRSLEIILEDDEGATGITLDGDATLELDGVRLGDLDLAGVDPVGSGDGTPGKDDPSRPLPPSDVRANARQIVISLEKEGGHSIHAYDGVHAEQRSPAGELERRLDCVELHARLPESRSSTFSVDARGNTEKPVDFLDRTLSPELGAIAASVSVKGQEEIVLTGSPAVLLSGADSIEGVALHFDPRNRHAHASQGELIIRIARGKTPVTIRGGSVDLDPVTGRWVLLAAEGGDAHASGVDNRATFDLTAPRIEVDPETEFALCPQGGRIDLSRPNEAGGAAEEVLFEADGSMSYSREAGAVTARGGVHARSNSQGKPFELWAQSASAVLAAPPARETEEDDRVPMELREVRGTGSVRVISGPYEVTGHEVRWDAVTRRITVTRSGTEILRLVDRKSGITYEAIDFWLAEGESSGQGRAFGGTYLRIARK